ncbi:MAG: hypothetical protein Q9160_005629 [Pyrenula sp. 1 TL-2023]
MSQTPPTIVFFAGAFAEPSCFNILSEHFREQGYPTIYANIPSLNPADAAAASTSHDAEETRNKTLLPLLEANKDVVVFVHSYGGVVGGAAAAGLSKQARAAEGKSGGVIGLVYLVASLVSEGESMLQSVGGAYPPFIKQNYPSQGLAVIDPVMPTLYGDADPALAPKLEAAMRPHALAAFETPATAPAWAQSAFDGWRVFIRTIDDQCNPKTLQDIWLQKSRVQWDIVDIQSSHSPFVSRLAKIAMITIGLIKKWA